MWGPPNEFAGEGKNELGEGALRAPSPQLIWARGFNPRAQISQRYAKYDSYKKNK